MVEWLQVLRLRPVFKAVQIGTGQHAPEQVLEEVDVPGKPALWAKWRAGIGKESEASLVAHVRPSQFPLNLRGLRPADGMRRHSRGGGLS
jgi:hypothetical protein